MSRNQAPKSLWSTLPPEILLEIISEINHVSRINLAIANPEIFLRSTFNVFEQDAWSQVDRRQKNGPLIETRETWPLIYTAIENNTNIQIIARILKTYVSVYPSSIDGVWGEGLIALPPPIVFAAGLGKPQIVSLLLEEGADPARHCGTQFFAPPPEDEFECTLRGFNHARCEPLGDDRSDISRYITVLRAAVTRAVQIDSPGSIEHQEAEECALILHRKGLPRNPGRQLIDPIRAQFDRYVMAAVDRLVTLNQGGQPTMAFNIILYHALEAACKYQRRDNDRTIIEYLVNIGAPLIHPTSENRYKLISTGAYDLASRGHVETAVFLLNRYADQGVLLDYAAFELVSGEHMLAYLQAFYRLMSQPKQSYGGVAASRKYLHGLLLRRAMNAFQKPAIRWLVEQGVGVGSREHIHHAISIGNKIALQALVEAGHVVNGMADLYGDKRSPLERALIRGEFDTVIFLISKGGDAALVREETKKMLLIEYGKQFPTIPYVESKKMVTPAMLRPEFFTIDDLPRRMAMFHYVIG
ncbi:hypothetical protein GGR51DRAFT_571935 [Nemania sp. FL0031]|nr:hypothetical protein GGR51DRAFT_571935 [Nemania sp. FL0031]